MNSHMKQELLEIARAGHVSAFTALDKLAEAQAADTSGGATNLPGHCSRCSCELHEGDKTCSECGMKVKHVLDLKGLKKSILSQRKKKDDTEPKDDEPDDGGEYGTGAEEAIDETRERTMNETDSTKYAGVAQRIGLSPFQKVTGITSVLGGLYAGKKFNDTLSSGDPVSVEKQAGVRSGNPILNMRRHGWKTTPPSKALRKMKRRRLAAKK